MRYRTESERRWLVVLAATGLAALICFAAVLGAGNGLERCLKTHSADTCQYALR